MKSTLRIYGCGGTGLNITQQLTITGLSAGFPVTEISQIDTSTSNVGEVQSNCKFNLIPGVFGTGKNRKFSIGVVKPVIPKMLLANPPADFNIVVFGASGGSGSVIGPLVMEELLKRGHPTVGFVVSSTISGTEVENTIGCLTDLNKISTRLNLPVVCGFFQNGNFNRDEINHSIEVRIRALAMLVSGENEEIDMTDVSNWCNYTTNVKVPPALVHMLVVLGEPDRIDIPSHALSMITLHANSESIGMEECMPLYHAEGKLNDAALNATTHEINTMDFVITNTLLDPWVEELVATRDQFKSFLEQSVAVKATLFADEDGVM